MNLKNAEKAIYDLLLALDENPEREGLKETPKRVAKMYQELLAGQNSDASEHLSKQFPVGQGGLLLEKDIPFHSLCEHHMLPFFGKAHIAYIPKQSVVGLSKLARTVEVFARRLQLQEVMSSQIANAIMEQLDTEGVMVVIEAEHMCMNMRGVKKPGTSTMTIATRGIFNDDMALQHQVLEMIRR